MQKILHSNNSITIIPDAAQRFTIPVQSYRVERVDEVNEMQIAEFTFQVSQNLRYNVQKEPGYYSHSVTTDGVFGKFEHVLGYPKIDRQRGLVTLKCLCVPEEVA